MLLVLIAVGVAANLGSAGLDGVALPALAHGPLHASAQGYGAILAGFAAGGLLGTLTAGQSRTPRRPAAGHRLDGVPRRGGGHRGHLPSWGASAGSSLRRRCSAPATGSATPLPSRRSSAGRRGAALGTGRLNGLLLLTSFGVAPVSVLLAAWSGRALGPASFFLFAAVTIAAAVLGGLTQRSWRDFGAASPHEAAAAAAPGARQPWTRLAGRDTGDLRAGAGPGRRRRRAIACRSWNSRRSSSGHSGASSPAWKSGTTGASGRRRS